MGKIILKIQHRLPWTMRHSSNLLILWFNLPIIFRKMIIFFSSSHSVSHWCTSLSTSIVTFTWHSLISCQIWKMTNKLNACGVVCQCPDSLYTLNLWMNLYYSYSQMFFFFQIQSTTRLIERSFRFLYLRDTIDYHQPMELFDSWIVLITSKGLTCSVR